MRAVQSAAAELRVVYQPIRELVSGATVGQEALSRFPGGPPDAWFGQAHQVGLGAELEIAAVAQAVAGRDHRAGYLSVNVSPGVITTSQFISFVLELPEPRRLVVELTEHTAVLDYDRLHRALQQLRRAGVRVAVDDAGGGVSSFRHILMLGPEIIKLDRSLIAGLDSHVGRQALAELMVPFAERIGAQLVAEGIESAEECAACVQHGIKYGQGYFLGRPGVNEVSTVGRKDTHVSAADIGSRPCPARPVSPVSPATPVSDRASRRSR